MSELVWATTIEVRAYPASSIPADMPDAALALYIDKAVRAIERTILRWPAIDEMTGRAQDPGVRALLIVAIAETIALRRRNEATEAALGGLAPILAAGGTIATKTLSASTGTSGAGHAGAAIGERATRIPVDALDALQSAGLISGSARTW